MVTSLIVGVEGRGRTRLFDAVAEATQRIVEAEDEFEAVSREVSRVAEVLLEYEADWNQAANWGEVFRKEEDASGYGEECFTDLAGRYLSAGDGSGESDQLPGHATGTSVVMLTVAYEGEVPELEKTAATRQEVAAALQSIIALQRRGQLLLAHVHQSPGTRDEVLTDDQLLVNYPELLTL